MAALHSPAYAVSVQNLSLSYGFAFTRTKVNILKEINIHVDTGSIYGLLGPSGCGKTTLLRCLIGKLKPEKGLVTLFGTTPGSTNSIIPGSGVGYMPQEIALLKTLSVLEVLSYHGRLHQMKPKHIKARIEFLLEFLNLKQKTTTIEKLSGGQQRRVSFAAALLHEPPLLILDEPTVGVDPILRQSIWDHLFDICSSGKVTVIITTHYIEEARLANKIGLMRNGRMIAEEDPNILLNRHNLSTLEDVYLKLCREDAIRNDAKVNSETVSLTKHQTLLQIKKNSTSNPDVIVIPSQKPNFKDYLKFPSLSHIYALLILNMLRLWRSKILLVFTLLTPIIEVGIFCVGVGTDPKNIPVAVANHDTDLGQKFLQQINKKTVTLIHVADIDEAVALVLNGKAVATLQIEQNFTSSLMHRFRSRRNITNEIISSGSIRLRFDTIDKQLLISLQNTFYAGMKQFAENELVDEHLPHIISNMFDMGEPVYGSEKLPYSEFMTFGVLLCLIFFLASFLSAVVFVNDKRENIYERNVAEGVTSIELLLGHVLVQVIVVIIQILLVFLLVIEGFRLENKGNLIWAYLLSLLQGIAGVVYGFFISIVCDDETSAMLLALGSFYPYTLLSGAIWPLQATEPIVQKLCLFMPQTIANTSLRWIMLRGKDFTWMSVWLGYVTTIGWILMFAMLSLLTMRFKH